MRKTRTPPLLLPLPGNEALAAALAVALRGDIGSLTARSFPDGETYVRIETPVAGRQVFFVCTLDRPNGKLLPLLFGADAAKDLGAARLGLVAPYLAYMRQDRRFREGEAVTSTTFAALLSRAFDGIVTVDPHLHRRTSLSAIYPIPTVVVHAAPLVAEWIRTNVKHPIVVGPDEESQQWVGAVAELAGAPHVVLEKVRRGDRDVEISLPDEFGWRERTPVLVDDIISTAQTMTKAVRQLVLRGCAAPVCVGVHAVFAGSGAATTSAHAGDARDSAHAGLLAAGAARVVTTNTIPHVSSEIDVTRLLAGACEGLYDGGTPSRS